MLSITGTVMKIKLEEKRFTTEIETFISRGENGGFSQEQLDMYKECFKLMDVDKDGTINKTDLRAAFDNVGVLMSEGELDDMLSEVGGACSFDAMVQCFQNKMAGGEKENID